MNITRHEYLDYIEGTGTTAGTVNEIGLFTTRLTKADGIVMYVPNSLIWANPVTNYSTNDRRRVVINFQAQHGLQVEHVLGELRRLVTDDGRIEQNKPAPWIAVTDYTDTGVKYNVGAWTSAAARRRSLRGPTRSSTATGRLGYRSTPCACPCAAPWATSSRAGATG